MRCPYNKKVICDYLEDTRIYHCPECSHYVPYPEYEKQGNLFAVLIVLGIIVIVLGLMYFVGQFFLTPRL